MYACVMDINKIKKDLYEIKRTAFGLSIPEIRKLAKKLAKDDYKEFLIQNKNDDYWMKILHAFLLGYISADINILLRYFEDFIPFVDDWAVNDSLCQNFKQARKFQKEVWSMLMKYKNSKKEFEVRVVAVMLLSHYMNDDYIDKVINVINNLHTNAYYSRMGVAWAVAEICSKYPEKCLEYLNSKNNKLDDWTYNKSLQKMRESYRVPQKIKNLTYQMSKNRNPKSMKSGI